MKKIVFILSGLALLIGSAFVITSFTASKPVSTVTPPVENEIHWISMEEAMALNEKEPRYWIIDVYTDWCGWCKRMDATTFKDPHITEVINNYFYAVKLDAEQKEDIILKDRTYKFVESGRRGYHELAAELLQGKMSYPTTVYLDKNANMIQPLAGFQAAEDLHPILQFFGTGAYTTTSWEDFKAAYKSPFSPPTPQ